MRFLGRNLRRRFARRVCAVVALVAYLIAAVGFPIPAAPARGDGIPFPCMNHACGCRSAEQCWRSCCCLTVEERWAWAREHNVEPPPYAERPAPKPAVADRPAAKGWNTPRLRDQAEGRTAAAHACRDCARKAEAKTGTVAARRPCCAKDPPARPESTKDLRWVGGSAALGCHGQSTLWITSGAVTAPPDSPAWEPFAPPAEWLSFCPESPLGPSLVPPDPPPRCTHA
jgi:hypothetical protein